MNGINFLADGVQKQFPKATIKIDEPIKKKGNYWLDVVSKKKRFVVEWRPRRGFGFYDDGIGYGESPTVIIRDRGHALKHLISLLE